MSSFKLLSTVVDLFREAIQEEQKRRKAPAPPIKWVPIMSRPIEEGQKNSAKPWEKMNKKKWLGGIPPRKGFSWKR